MSRADFFSMPYLSLWTNHSFRVGAGYIAWFVRKTMWLEFQLGESWTGYGKWLQIYTAYRSKQFLSCDYLPMHYIFLFIYLLIYGLFNDAVSDSDHKSRLLRFCPVIKHENLKWKAFGLIERVILPLALEDWGKPWMTWISTDNTLFKIRIPFPEFFLFNLD